MKIKTFIFNIFSSCTDDEMHMKKQNLHDEYETLYTQERIDKEINDFIKDKKLIDIKINELKKSFTNNNGTNKICVLYTIIYDDKNTYKLV